MANYSAFYFKNSVFVDNTANHTGGAVYGLSSQIYLSGNGTFVGNRARWLSDGTAVSIEHTNITFDGCFNFFNNQIIKYMNNFYLGSTIAALDSFLTLQGVFHFINNSNSYGGAILLHHTDCLIGGHLKFAGNRAIFDGGAIYARYYSTLIIQGDELASPDLFDSDCFSKSYPQGIVFYNNSAGEVGGAIHLEESSMTLTGSVIFVANKAECGGGITVYTEAGVNSPNRIVFQEPLDLLFSSNIASKFSGAIFINDVSLDTRLCEYVTLQRIFKCFFTIKFDSNDIINLTFTSNQALAGTGIYGGALQYCQVKVQNVLQLGYEVLQDLIRTSTEVQMLYDSSDAFKNLLLYKWHCHRYMFPM